MNLKTKACVSVVVAGGLFALGSALRSWNVADPALFLAILTLGIIGSFFKVTIFGLNGSMSMAFMFIMLGVTRLTLGETLCVGVCATLVQTYWRQKKKSDPIIAVFNVQLIAAVIGAAYFLYHAAWATRLVHGSITRLCFVSIAYFLLNTWPVAVVISLTSGQNILKVWKDSYAWSFTYYLLGASAVGIFNVLERNSGLEMALLALPIAFVGYRSYQMRINSLEAARIHAEESAKHSEQIASLHLRTIRALALAIEAKDTTTGEHLHRVQTYAVEMGRELKLSEEELQALGAASILHDIGKIAVPEYIISKPGKLSKEEFDRMKVHPLVGGEIIESVSFPYPVAPIVNAHHEKWDGTGYPRGIKGDQIPIGARILSAVDCLDALASDRQYRRALPIDQAMDFVKSESGKAFDPMVVEILSRRYQELETLAKSTTQPDYLGLSLTARIEKGFAPDAGLETGHLRSERAGGASNSVFDRISADVSESQILDRLYVLLNGRRSVPELLLRLISGLDGVIPVDGAALFVRDGDWVRADFVTGTAAEPLLGLSVPIGTGLSGWVAEHRISLLNGNPSTEWALGGAVPAGFNLRSALAIPLETEKGLLAVLTLYSETRDAFHGGHLRLCLGLRSRLALSLEATISAANLRAAAALGQSGLPNMGALLGRLDQQLSPWSKTEPFAVLAMRCLGGLDVSILDCAKGFVNQFGFGSGFLAQVSERDLVAVLPLLGDLQALETDLAATLNSAQSSREIRAGQEILIGSAAATSGALNPETLLSVAAARFHPCAISNAPKAIAQNAGDLSALNCSLTSQSPAVEERPIHH